MLCALSSSKGSPVDVSHKFTIVLCSQVSAVFIVYDLDICLELSWSYNLHICVPVNPDFTQKETVLDLALKNLFVTFVKIDLQNIVLLFHTVLFQLSQQLLHLF